MDAVLCLGKDEGEPMNFESTLPEGKFVVDAGVETTSPFQQYCASMDPKMERKHVREIERSLRNKPDIGPFLESNREVLHADLLRFLRAKKGHVQAATDKAARYYRWCFQERPDLIGEDEIGAELDSGKVLYMGNDKEGRPVYLIRAARHFPPAHSRGYPRHSTQKLLIAAVRFATTQMQHGATNTNKGCIGAASNVRHVKILACK